jgi:hypothetical protein
MAADQADALLRPRPFIRIHAMVRRRSLQKRLARANLAQETSLCRSKEIDEIQPKEL